MTVRVTKTTLGIVVGTRNLGVTVTKATLGIVSSTTELSPIPPPFRRPQASVS